MRTWSEILTGRNKVAANSAAYEAATGALMRLATDRKRIEGELADIRESRKALAKALPHFETLDENITAPAPSLRNTARSVARLGVNVKAHCLSLVHGGLEYCAQREKVLKADFEVCLAEIKLQERNRDEAERNHNSADEQELVSHRV